MFKRALIFAALLPLLLLTVGREGLDGRAPAAASVSKAKTVSLCAPSERVLWSCEIRGQRKFASLCASKELDQSRGYVQYRFGRPNQVELEFPNARPNSQRAFKYSRYTRPLVTYLSLRFERGGASYTISDDYNDEEKPARRDASIMVKPAGATTKESTLKCKLPVTGSLSQLEDIVPRAEDQ